MAVPDCQQWGSVVSLTRCELPNEAGMDLCGQLAVSLSLVSPGATVKRLQFPVKCVTLLIPLSPVCRIPEYISEEISWMCLLNLV